MQNIMKIKQKKVHLHYLIEEAPYFEEGLWDCLNRYKKSVFKSG